MNAVATGIVRSVDELGRVVIPKEMRVSFGMTELTPIQFYVSGEHICIKRYQPGCFSCGSEKELLKWKEKSVCKVCLDELKKLS